MKSYKELTREDLQQDFNNLKNFKAIGEKYNTTQSTMQKLGKKLDIICIDTNKALNITHPEWCNEWHPTKNGDLKSEHITAGSHKRVHWICKINPEHEWETSVKKRKRCPYCSGRKADRSNNLLIIYPDIAKEWNYDKNIGINPQDFTSRSNVVVWWKCKKEPKHEWEARIADRKFNGCPYCSGTKVNETNSLFSLCSELCKEWHPIKNGDKKPQDYTRGSGEIIWWICCNDPKHEWKASINSRTTKSYELGCPYCYGCLADDKNNLLIKYPNISKEWHQTKNGNNKPEQFKPGSHFNAWWQCDKNSGHEWQTSIKIRTNGHNCPYCNKHTTDDEYNLLILYPDLAAQWHPIKNGNNKPEHFKPGSSFKAWWICNKNPEHEWKTSIKNRVKLKNECPFHSSTITKPEIQWLEYLKIPKEKRHKIIMINKKRYNVDAYDQDTNTVYEFYGDYWHGNPKKYKPNDINKKNKKTYKELYDKTMKREIELKQAGYNLITIWESDFKILFREYVQELQELPPKL